MQAWNKRINKLCLQNFLFWCIAHSNQWRVPRGIIGALFARYHCCKRQPKASGEELCPRATSGHSPRSEYRLSTARSVPSGRSRIVALPPQWHHCPLDTQRRPLPPRLPRHYCSQSRRSPWWPGANAERLPRGLARSEDTMRFKKLIILITK